MRFADLRATNVRGACFCGAALTGADFRGSNVTAQQLACANVACDTILPNGKPALPCGAGERCCGGACVDLDTDPDNCGRCGNPCDVCQVCHDGTCQGLADGQFDCTGAPLAAAGGGVCTTGPHTGICDGGLCHCGPGGDFDAVANICRCNQDSTINCDDDATGQCCEILETCLVNGQFQTEFVCFACGSGGTTNLCCEYSCGGAGPDKFVCIPNATPGVTQCDESFEGCAFSDGDFVHACADCGASKPGSRSGAIMISGGPDRSLGCPAPSGEIATLAHLRPQPCPWAAVTASPGPIPASLVVSCRALSGHCQGVVSVPAASAL